MYLMVIHSEIYMNILMYLYFMKGQDVWDQNSWKSDEYIVRHQVIRSRNINSVRLMDSADPLGIP